MKKVFGFLIAATFITYSSQAHSQVNLNIKIGQNAVKSVSANYGQDVVVSADGLSNKLVFNLRKFKNILVNGNKINPVQIDMKIVNDMKKVIGKPQTITSFYNKSAEFSVSSTGLKNDAADMNVRLNFEEI